MPHAIWKYVLEEKNLQTLEMPEKCYFVKADYQGDNLCVWVAVDTEAKLAPKQIQIVGTGGYFSATSSIYIGTVFRGPLVWHIFEIV